MKGGVFSLIAKPIERLKQRFKPVIVRAFYSYNAGDFTKELRRMRLREGDLVMVHSGFRATNGFKGGPQELVEALIGAIGPTGTLAMMSMAYQNMRSHDYLLRGKPFDVRRSVAMTGIVAEVFRRRPDVTRGVHPTHSVAAWGRLADWLVSGQGLDLSPFGDNSPFARMAEADGKVLLIDVPFDVMTFEHHLEHSIQDNIPCPLYAPQPMTGIVVDKNGQRHEVLTLVLSEEVEKYRRRSLLEEEFVRRGILKHGRVGRTGLMLAGARDMLAGVNDMVLSGRGFHMVGPS